MQESRKVSRRQNQPVAYSVENDEVEQELDHTSFMIPVDVTITPPKPKVTSSRIISCGALSRCYARPCLYETEAMQDAFRWLLNVGDNFVGVGVSTKV